MEMTHSEMKAELLARKAGYEALALFNATEARNATLQQKIRSFEQIMELSLLMPESDLDVEGNIAVKPRFLDRASNFKNDLALIERDRMWAYIDAQGEIVWLEAEL